MNWGPSDDKLAQDRANDDDQLLWGDRPADLVEDGLQRLIDRLLAELGRCPSVVEIDELVHGPRVAPEIVEAIANAAKAFREDIGRDPTDAELAAGLLFADTPTALLRCLALDIQVGDPVMWAECDENGQRLHQTLDGRDDMIVPAYGTVIAQPQGWQGENIIRCDDGRIISLARTWLIRVRS